MKRCAFFVSAVVLFVTDVTAKTERHELKLRADSAIGFANAMKRSFHHAKTASAATSCGGATEAPCPDKKGAAPEQGFEGGLIEHKDRETMTGDWGREFGPKGPPPHPAVGGASSVKDISTAFAAVIAAILVA